MRLRLLEEAWFAHSYLRCAIPLTCARLALAPIIVRGDFGIPLPKQNLEHLMRRIYWAILAALTMLSGRATAQTGPTDVELKAAYCLGVTKTTQPIASEMWAEVQAAHQETLPAGVVIRRNLDEQNDRLNRLRAYVLPKLMDDQTMQIAIAGKRGESDALQLQSPTLLQCTSQCKPPSQNTPDETANFKSCLVACSPALPRVWSCNDTSWLPY